MPDLIRAILSSHGRREFLDCLRRNDVPFDRPMPEPGKILARTGWIEIVTVVGGASIVPSIAAVIVQWLKNKASRKVTVQTRDKRIIHLEGFDIDKVSSILEEAESIVVVQPTGESNADVEYDPESLHEVEQRFAETRRRILEIEERALKKLESKGGSSDESD